MMSLTLLLSLLFAAGEEPDLKALMRDARSKDYVARLAAYDGLLALGDAARPAFTRILREAEHKAARDFRALADGPDASRFRKWLKKEVETARAAALQIIRDREAYPDDAHGAVGQHLVDNKVALLRELWLHPSAHFAEKVPAVNDRLYYVKEASDYLKRAGLEPEIFLNRREATAELDQRLAVRDLMLSKKEQSDVDAILEYNDTAPSVATDEERRFARILNDYRLMLGLSVLELDDRLVIASRKHSQEMLDLDYFAHQSPVEENRTPDQRAAREGYGGGVLENCAIAQDAAGAFDGWYRSSGHHRGMIAASVRQLGAGHAVQKDGRPGRQWTMLAGSANSLRGKKPKEDPRLLFAARLQGLREGDVDTRFALVRFARKHDLSDQAQRLLLEIVAIDAENRAARELLGHVRSNGRWVTAREKLEQDLAVSGGAEAVAAVSAALRDADPAMRVAALEAGATLGADLVPLAVSALKDPASEVRLAACEALGSAAAPSASAALRGMLGDASFYVAHSAAAALVRAGDASGIPVLFKGLRSGDLNHRIDAHRQARAVFGKDFGYAWDLPDVERARVVDEWEAWVQEQGSGG